jgi:hypothetical protein
MSLLEQITFVCERVEKVGEERYLSVMRELKTGQEIRVESSSPTLPGTPYELGLRGIYPGFVNNQRCMDDPLSIKIGDCRLEAVDISWKAEHSKPPFWLNLTQSQAHAGKDTWTITDKDKREADNLINKGRRVHVEAIGPGGRKYTAVYNDALRNRLVFCDNGSAGREIYWIINFAVARADNVPGVVKCD